MTFDYYARLEVTLANGKVEEEPFYYVENAFCVIEELRKRVIYKQWRIVRLTDNVTLAQSKDYKP